MLNAQKGGNHNREKIIIQNINFLKRHMVQQNRFVFRRLRNAHTYTQAPAHTSILTAHNLIYSQLKQITNGDLRRRKIA